jgi:hypothetical protein
MAIARRWLAYGTNPPACERMIASDGCRRTTPLCTPSTFAIPKAASVEHVAENAGAADLRLSPAEIRRIDAAFPRAPRPRSLPTL